MSTDLLIDRVGADGRVARITLNRPEKMNALSPEMLYELDDALHDLEADDSARVIVLRGAGRAFCAGFDLGGIYGKRHGASAESDSGAGDAPSANGQRRGGGRSYRMVDEQGRRLLMGIRTSLQQITDLQLYFWNMAKVTIAQVHGACLAGGCEFAMMADLIVAAEDARIGHPGQRGMGVSRTGCIWPLMIGMRKAKELAYTGDSVSGAEAARIGMVNYAYPLDELESRTIALADHVAVLSADHLAILKLSMNRFYENMGIYSSVRSASDHDAAGQFTAQAYAWQEAVRGSLGAGRGMRDAIAWRDGSHEGFQP